MDNKKEIEAYKNYQNNAYGRSFESGIEYACKYYAMKKIAVINKTPEPFRVTRKFQKGIFQGRFIARAYPDFQGTLKNGRAIIFEAKYTTTQIMRKSVITDRQKEVLEEYFSLGALSAVCLGIRDHYFFVPWEIWRELEKYTQKKSATQDDLTAWEVPWQQGIMFLANIKTR